MSNRRKLTMAEAVALDAEPKRKFLLEVGHRLFFGYDKWEARYQVGKNDVSILYEGEYSDVVDVALADPTFHVLHKTYRSPGAGRTAMSTLHIWRYHDNKTPRINQPFIQVGPKRTRKIELAEREKNLWWLSRYAVAADSKDIICRICHASIDHAGNSELNDNALAKYTLARIGPWHKSSCPLYYDAMKVNRTFNFEEETVRLRLSE